MGALMLGDHAAADLALIEALEASLVIDDRPGLVMRMQMLASSAAMAGRATRAAELLGASEMLRLRIGVRKSPFMTSHVEMAQEKATTVLGADRFAKAYEEGARLDREGAIALALGKRSRPPDTAWPKRTRSPIRLANASGRSRTSLPKG